MKVLRKSLYWMQPDYYVTNRKMREFVHRDPIYFYLLMFCISLAKRSGLNNGELIDSDDTPIDADALAYYCRVDIELCERFFIDATESGYIILKGDCYSVDFWEDFCVNPSETPEAMAERKRRSRRRRREASAGVKKSSTSNVTTGFVTGHEDVTTESVTGHDSTVTCHAYKNRIEKNRLEIEEEKNLQDFFSSSKISNNKNKSKIRDHSDSVSEKEDNFEKVAHCIQSSLPVTETSASSLGGEGVVSAGEADVLPKGEDLLGIVSLALSCASGWHVNTRAPQDRSLLVDFLEARGFDVGRFDSFDFLKQIEQICYSEQYECHGFKGGIGGLPVRLLVLSVGTAVFHLDLPKDLDLASESILKAIRTSSSFSKANYEEAWKSSLRELLRGFPPDDVDMALGCSEDRLIEFLDNLTPKNKVHSTVDLKGSEN